MLIFCYLSPQVAKDKHVWHWHQSTWWGHILFLMVRMGLLTKLSPTKLPNLKKHFTAKTTLYDCKAEKIAAFYFCSNFVKLYYILKEICNKTATELSISHGRCFCRILWNVICPSVNNHSSSTMFDVPCCFWQTHSWMTVHIL